MDVEDDYSTDDESVGSIKDFIVPDDVISEESEKNELEKEDLDKIEPVVGTVVGGRVLRSRDPESIEKRRPKDDYYERFGRKEEEKLLIQDTKKDIVKYVKTLEAEWRVSYEESGKKWPVLNTKMSLEKIRSEYQDIKDFAKLPDSDDESSEGEESDDDDDDDAEDDEDDEDDAEDDAEDDDEDDAEDDDEDEAEDDDAEAEDEDDAEDDDAEAEDDEADDEALE
jgi:hypothetical protein